MAWQDELKALDDALATGKISPDQHRLQRDELLAAASGGGPAVGRWVVANPAANHGQPQAPDQVRNPAADAERTQVVSSGATDSERTQVVRPVSGPFPQQPQQPQQPRPPYPPQHQPGPHSGGFPAPPWSDNAPSWQMQGMQGPEVFAQAGPGPKKWLGVLVVVLVVALIGGAVWWFGFRSSNDTGTGTSSTGSTSTAAGSAFDAGRLPDPKGQPRAKNGEYSLDDAKSSKVVSEKDVKALEASGVTRLVDKVASKDGVSFAASAFVAKDATAAGELADALVANQTAAGMTPFEGGSLPESVSLMKLATGDQFLYRALYTSGDVTIRIATAAPSTVPEQVVVDNFQTYVAEVVESVKPG